MPPTPEQLQINESAQLTPQQPQVSAVPARANYVEEGVVSMPSPQMWMGGVDPGDNWWNLGSNAAKAGMDIYNSVNDGLLASRRQNAENDMNNLQNISLEKPESPDMTPYQLKEWQQGQQQKLNTATYSALMNQGLNSEEATGVLNGTVNPAGFQMYASDIQNILHLTRYQGQTNASMVNDIQRYDNAIWTGSVENFYNADSNMYGAYQGANTEEITSQYNKHIQDVIDSTGFTKDELKTIDINTISPNKRDRVMLARYLMDKNNYQDSMKESIKQTTDKILDEAAVLYSSSHTAMLFGEISVEQFLEQVDKTSTYIDDQIKLETKLQTQPYGLDSSTTLEERKQARLLENPNQAVDILYSRRQASNEKMMLLTEALTQVTSVTDIKRIENLMKDEQQTQLELDNIGAKIDIGFLTPHSQQKIEVFKRTSWATLQATSKEKVAEVQSQYLNELEINTQNGMKDVSNTVDLFMQVQNRLGTLPTKKDWLEKIKGLPHMSSYDDITEQLPETRDNSKTSTYDKIPIDRLQDILTRSLTTKLLIKNGVPITDGVLNSTDKLVRLAVEVINKGTISRRASSASSANEQLSGINSASSASNKAQDLKTTKENIIAGNPGVVPSEGIKATKDSFDQFMGNPQSQPEDKAFIYKFNPETAAEIGKVFQNSEVDRMAWYERLLRGDISPDLVLKYAKNARAFVASGARLPEGSSKADIEYAANFMTFVANKIGFNGQTKLMEEHKMDPTVINKQWGNFLLRRDMAFRSLATLKSNTTLTPTEHAAASTMLEVIMGNMNGINQGKDLFNLVTHAPVGADMARTILKSTTDSLGFSGWNSTEGLLTDLITLTKQDPTKDVITPTLIGILSAQPGDTIEQIQTRIHEYESFNGLRIKQKLTEDPNAWFSKVKMTPVISNDAMGRATIGASAPNMNTGSITPDSWANPMNQVKMNLDNYVYGKQTPGRKTSEGKDIIDTDPKFLINRDNMVDAYRSALPMSTNKEAVKRDKSKSVVVLNALMDVYDSHESREERMAHISDPNHPFYKWAMQFPVGPNGKPSPIDQSRLNWLALTLSKDELSYTSAVELGLNDPSHIGANTGLSRPQIESQARFKTIEMHDGDFQRNTIHQDDVGIQQSSNHTRLPDGSYYYDLTSNEPVLVKNEQGNYMDQAGNAAFKLGTNTDLNIKLSDKWLESNAGNRWELVDPRTGISKKMILIPGKIYSGDPRANNYTETIINKDTNTIQIHVVSPNLETGGSLETTQQLYPKKLLEHKNYDLPTPVVPTPEVPTPEVPTPEVPTPEVPTPVETLDQKKERFKKEGMTDADIERMLKFKSVNPDAVSPGAVSGNAEDRMAKIIAEDNATNVPEFVRNKPTAFEDQQRYWKNVDNKINTAKQELLTMFDNNSKFQTWLNNYFKPTMEDINNASVNSKFIKERNLLNPDTKKQIAQVYSFRDKMIEFFHLDKADRYINNYTDQGGGFVGKKAEALYLTNQERIDIAQTMYKNGIFSEQEFTNIKNHYDKRTFYENKNAQDKIDEAAKQEKWDQEKEKTIQDRAKNKPQQDKIDEAAKQELLTMFDNDSSKKSKVNAFYNKAKTLGMAYDEDHPDTYLNENDSLRIAEILYKNNTLTKEEYIKIKEQLKERQDVRNNAISDYQAKEFKKNKRG